MASVEITPTTESEPSVEPTSETSLEAQVEEVSAEHVVC